MAAILCRFSKGLFTRPVNRISFLQIATNEVGETFNQRRKPLVYKVGIATAIASGCTLVVSIAALVMSRVKAATEVELHPPHYPWRHKGFLCTYDYFSVKRGYQVYKQVCRTCHSLKYTTFYLLCGKIFNEEETKAEAAEYTTNDEPNEEGEVLERPCKWHDTFPNPYPNQQTAKFANNGSEPPDMSLLRMAREGEEDYIFALLTSYRDPPTGIKLEAGQFYNPYFHGGAIAMTPPIFDGAVEYSDGTVASTSQIAKDVTNFLCFTSDPHKDRRRKYLIKGMLYVLPLLFIAVYYNRFIWSPLKSRKLVFAPRRSIRRRYHI